MTLPRSPSSGRSWSLIPMATAVSRHTTSWLLTHSRLPQRVMWLDTRALRQLASQESTALRHALGCLACRLHLSVVFRPRHFLTLVSGSVTRLQCLAPRSLTTHPRHVSEVFMWRLAPTPSHMVQSCVSRSIHETLFLCLRLTGARRFACAAMWLSL